MRIPLLAVMPLIAGALLLVPFGIFFAIATGGQFLNLLGLFNSWNADIGEVVSRHVYLAPLALIVAPAIAAAIGTLTFTYAYHRRESEGRLVILAGSLGIAVVGSCMLGLLFGHDAIPCLFNGLLRQGFHSIGPLIKACKDA